MWRSSVVAIGLSLSAAAFWACSSSSSNGTSGRLSDAGDEPFSTTAPAAEYTENSSIGIPSGSSALGAIAVDANSGALYVAAGTEILRGSATTSGSLSPFADLSLAGFSTVSTMRVANNGDLVVAASDRAVHVTASGNVGAPIPVAVPFATGGFGGASLAISPDGQTLFAVEGGSGSPGSGGTNAVHVARFDLQSLDAAAPGAPIDVFELGSPFEIVPSTTANINADAPFVSLDGTLLYVPHVVLRNVFAVTVSAPHTVSIVNTDSLNRSVTAVSLDSNKLLVESAVFDQTVPVFRMNDNRTASLLVEIPVGLSPGAVASYKSRVFVVMSSGFGGGGGGPPIGDGGFPFGDGGFPFGDGGFPGQGSGTDGGDSGSPSIRVFDLRVGL